MNIHYNDSVLPIAVDVQIADNHYQESLEWTQSGKLASHHFTYLKAQNNTYTYSSRGFLQSTQDANYVFDFDEPGKGMRTSAPNFEALRNGLDEFGRIIKEQSKKTLF